MKTKFINRLSVKVITLTLIMASMTVLASVVGIISLDKFKDEYTQVKKTNFQLLLKMTALKSETNDILHISTEMFLSEDINELQWDLLQISDKKLWVDKLFSQLTSRTNDRQELLRSKITLYAHLDEISNAMADKFKRYNDFIKIYDVAESMKDDSLQKNDMEFYIIIDEVISYFNPIFNSKLKSHKEDNIKALESYLNKVKKDLDSVEFLHLKKAFSVANTLSVSYQKYLVALDNIEVLHLENERFNGVFVGFLGDNVTYIQDQFIIKLAYLEEELKKRKQHLSLVVVFCVLVTLFLVLIQMDFIKRVRLIHRVILLGEENKKVDFPIKGKDEISHMALAVKNYIERLVAKEKEVLTINKQLEHLASHDGLTGIFNRRYFETFLIQEHSRYLRYKKVYCVAMIDLDFFKKINDNYGHDAGDKVLIEFSERVLQIIRKIDVFARFGGEEFVLLMPNTVEKNALMLMERIRLAICVNPYVYNGEEIHYTVSIGLTEVCDLQEKDEFKQIALADSALYEAKHAGRNRVRVYKGE